MTGFYIPKPKAAGTHQPLEFDCPRCGATKNRPCFNRVSLRTMTGFHMPRVKLAWWADDRNHTNTRDKP